MLTTTLRRATDNQCVPVHLGGLALMVRGRLELTREATNAAVSDASDSENSGGPAVIVNCASLEDAQQCMEFATRNDLLLWVFNGNGKDADPAVCKGGMAVDLSSVRATSP